MMRLFIYFICLLFGGAPFTQAMTRRDYITCINSNDFSAKFRYSNDGYIIKIVNNSDESLLWSYDYYVTIDGISHIMQYGYLRPNEEIHSFSVSEPSFKRESMLNMDNLICCDKNGNTFMWSTGENFEYYYEEGHMARIRGSNGVVINLSWTNGNLTDIYVIEDNEEVGRISCSYNEIQAKGIFSALNSPLALLLNYYTVQPIGPLAHGFYGYLCKNLLSEMTVSFVDKFKEKHALANYLSNEYYPIAERHNRRYRYEIDSEGYVVKVIINEDGLDTIYEIENNNTSTAVFPSSSLKEGDIINLQGFHLQTKPGKVFFIQNGKKYIR